MQTTNSVKIAVIPFKKGNEFASVVTDGKQVRAFRNGWEQSFTSIWWAVETLDSFGFIFDRETMKPFADASFDVIAATRGWTVRHIGNTWYGILDQKARVSGDTKWQCQVNAIRECLKYIS